MLAFHREKRAEATLFVHPNSHPFDSDIVLRDEDQRVCGFLPKTEERTDWYDNCVNAGFYMVNRRLCSRIPRGEKTDLEKQVLWPLARQGGTVYAYMSPEYIKDVGTPERIAAAAAELESESETAGEGEKGFFSGLISTVTDGVSGITDKVGEMVNRFMEALAVMLVTCCAIPVLVLLSFLWFAKILLSVELPVSYSGIHHGLKDRLFRKKRGEPQ